jgi:signal transduction histidine kinase
MSLKYRFIYTFVLLELVFIVLIVTINFYTIKNTSDKLINEKIESNTTFLEELIKVPISIFDLASLDNLVENSSKHVNSVVILDTQNRILSSAYNYKYLSIEELIKLEKNTNFQFEEYKFSVKYKKIYEEDTYLGSMYIIFDLSNITQVILSNKQNTFLIIILEILLSTVFAYLVGNRITKKLINLSDVAIKIGKEQHIQIPYKESNDEIGLLANAMQDMKSDLIHRSHIIKYSNELLKTQKDDLITANKIKDDFLANMSHELKTPLNSINVISSVMKKNSQNNLNEKQIKNLNIINQCGNELLFLVNDVLDLSKLEKAEIKLNKKVIDINDYFKKIYTTILPQAKQKNLQFKLNLNLTITTFDTDEQRLNQIINNLLSNAIKFTSKGTVTLDISNDYNQLIIIVQDTGIGIPKEKANHIFDRFKQVDTSTSRKYGGTGLGLAISKELIHLFKGEIFLSSKIDEGTKFEVHLPLDKKFNSILKESNGNIQMEINPNTKEKVLILNNDPIFFFKIIIELNKKYETVQVDNIHSFMEKNNKDKFYKAIINLKKEQIESIEELSNTNQTNYVVLYDEQINDDFPSFISSKYKRDHILQNLNTFKDLL